MEADKLYEEFKKYEKDGFYLHAEKEHVMRTIKSLLDMGTKYGHLACPCRLATGNKEDDADILCPCTYCKDDIVEHGACFCLLFVREDFKDDVDFYPDIEDRRPPEMVKF